MLGCGLRLTDASYEGGGTLGTDAAVLGENKGPAYVLNGGYGALLSGDGLFILAKNDDRSAFGCSSAGEGRDNPDKAVAFRLSGELGVVTLFITDIG